MSDDLLGFADAATIAQLYAQGSDSFLLGYSHPDHGKSFPVGISDDRHLFIKAGSRAGKGTSMIIPNLLHWQGGIFCIDPKGENANITAMRRGKKELAHGTGTSVRNFLEQNVAVLDPMGIVKGPSKTYRVSYDPLSDIAIGSDDEISQIISIGEAIVMDESGSDSHWADSARTIFNGIVEAVLHTETDKRKHTLSFVREVYQRGLKTNDDGKKTGKDYLSQAAKRKPGGLAQDAFTLLEDAGEDEAGSFSTTLSRQLQFLSDPRMQKHLSNESDFSLVDAIQNYWSIYLCLPPYQIPRMKRWLRMLIDVALQAKMATNHNHDKSKPNTLFMLDEFFALGKMKSIEESAAYMAGYGIKLVPVIQNIGQIKQLYDKNWETFLGNTGAIIAWGLNDLDSEQYISDRIGKILRYDVSTSAGSSKKSGSWFADSVSQNSSAALVERPARYPNEIHSDGARQTGRAYVVPASGEPFMVMRAEYHVEYKNDQIFDSEDFIEEWESAHGAHS
ncbi:MAG: type IV secretory system conjugative DNA transfer family protein [Pseudomonadota bacterium]